MQIHMYGFLGFFCFVYIANKIDRQNAITTLRASVIVITVMYSRVASNNPDN